MALLAVQHAPVYARMGSRNATSRNAFGTPFFNSSHRGGSAVSVLPVHRIVG